MTAGTAVLAGAVVGLGIYLVIRAVLPRRPDLRITLDRLHAGADGPARTPAAAETGARSGVWSGVWSGVRVPGGLARAAVLRPPVAELRLLGHGHQRYLWEKAAYPAVGLLFPVLLGTLVDAFGAHVRWYAPTAVGIACAVAMFFLVDVNVRLRAAQARLEFRRAVAAYLTLVGLVRYAGAGAVESLETAARAGDGWVFERIRQALDDARYANEAPWERMRTVAAEIGVPDLGDVGDIMSLAGEAGAQVYQSLLARARSLRVALRTKEQQRAAAATTLLYVPTTMLLLVFLALIGYPALARIAG